MRQVVAWIVRMVGACRSYVSPVLLFSFCFFGLNLTAKAGPEVLTYTYDVLGRLTQVSGDDGLTIDYAFDPSGNLVSRTVQLEQNRLYFPFYQASSGTFLGIAVSNFSPTKAALLDFTAFARQGSVPSLGKNPAHFSVPAQNQLARLGSEIFGVKAGQAEDFWVELVSDSSEIGSFFQFGDLTLTQLDGSVALPVSNRDFYLTRVYQGNAAFKGQKVRTSISLANPSDEAVAVRLRLFLPGQSPTDATNGPLGAVEAEKTQVIAPRGFFYGSAEVIFSRATISGGFIEGRVLGGGGVVAFSLIELPDRKTVVGLNGSFGNLGTELFSAQLADASVIYTSLKLVNVGDLPRTVRITAIAEDGRNLKLPKDVALAVRDQVELDMGQFFGFPTASALTIGSIKVEADGPGVIGDVLFGDPKGFKYAAAMPLLSRRIREAVFSQVANLANFFTGLAFYNPDTESTQITVQVFSSSGRLIGEAVIPLAAGSRRSNLVPELVPSAKGQAGGYIRISATRPIIAQQIFGESNLNQFSAVPPRVLK